MKRNDCNDSITRVLLDEASIITKVMRRIPTPKMQAGAAFLEAAANDTRAGNMDQNDLRLAIMQTREVI